MDTIIAIDDLAYGGDGVGRLPDGRAVFVPFTAVGDQVAVRLVQEKERFARAETVEIVAPGPGREEPVCPVFGVCGGCAYQHLAPDVELAAKTKQLRDVLGRIGGFKALPQVAVFGSPAAYEYRNKLRLAVAGEGADKREGDSDAEGDRERFAYHGVGTRGLVPVRDCPLGLPGLRSALGEARAKPGEQSRTWRQDAMGEVQAWADRQVPRGTLTEHLLGRSVRVPVGGFYQVNPPVLDAMCRWLRTLPGLGGPMLCDLFCGVGVFTLALGDRFAAGWGCELSRPAVRWAQANVRDWGLADRSFEVGPVERFFPFFLRQARGADTWTVLLDPPREGCPKALLAALRKARPAAILYVACDPAMLARDLQRLGTGEHYELAALGMFNMFPRTAHFESVAWLRRR